MVVLIQLMPSADLRCYLDFCSEEPSPSFSRTAAMRLADWVSRSSRVRLALPNMVGVTKACTSAKIGRVLPWSATMEEPVAPSKRALLKFHWGLTPTSSPRSQNANSLVEPKRFTKIRKVCWTFALKIKHGIHHMLQSSWICYVPSSSCTSMIKAWYWLVRCRTSGLRRRPDTGNFRRHNCLNGVNNQKIWLNLSISVRIFFGYAVSA